MTFSFPNSFFSVDFEAADAVLSGPARAWPLSAFSLLLLAGVAFRACLGDDAACSFRVLREFAAPALSSISRFRLAMVLLLRL